MLIELNQSQELYMQQPGSTEHLKEDSFIRELSWSRMYYSQEHFNRMVKDNEAWVGPLSATARRIRRCLWLGKKLAAVSLFFPPLHYSGL
jgi:hypothetical protein